MQEEPKYSNKLFLVGNGFDIGHGLKTGYIDFIRWYLIDSLNIALKISNTTYDDHCFKLIVSPHYANPKNHASLIHQLEKAIADKNIKQYIPTESLVSVSTIHTRRRSGDFTLKIIPTNDFIRNILERCFDCDWSGIEDEIYQYLQNELKSVKVKNQNNKASLKEFSGYKDASDRILSLNKSVEAIKNKLKEYLTTQNSPDTNKEPWIEKILRSNFEQENSLEPLARIMFLNFNYTTHIEDSGLLYHLRMHYDKFYSIIEVNYIHGNLKDKIDNMVFGVGDEANGFYEEVERECGNEWLACMKSFNYFKNNRYQELLEFINGPIPYEIYILGHSCSITDRTLLKMIFEHENCKSINIFHYQGIDSYLKTAYNIARNFSDKVKMRQVVLPYNSNLTMN